MANFLVEIDIDSLDVFVQAESEDEAIDKAYLKFKDMIKESGLSNIIKGYPIGLEERTDKNLVK